MGGSAASGGAARLCARSLGHHPPTPVKWSEETMRLPLTADSDCPHCHGLGVVMVEVYVPVELLRAGGNPVPRERKLCRCVRAEAPEQSATQLEGGDGG